MSVDKDTVKRFAKLFKGSQRVYGWYDARNLTTSENGKSTGKAFTRRTPQDPELTEDLYQEHLEGQSGLGIMPIQDDDTCLFGAIDIDEYGPDFNPEVVAAGIYRDSEALGLTPVITRSKSGALHVWFFFKKPIMAGVLMKKLNDIAAFYGYPGIEVFPKQSTVKNPQKPDELRVGNWINVPYFDARKTSRYGFALDGSSLSLSEFLTFARDRLTDTKHFREVDLEPSDSVPFADGPPCLQKLARQGIGEGGRNNVIYQCAVYFKKKLEDPEKVTVAVDEFNRQYIVPPMNSKELGTIRGSVLGGDYHYKCSDSPMKEFCNRTECIRRRYGVSDGGGSGSGINVSFEELTKYMYLDKDGNPTDNPAYWELTINDVVFRFEDEELMTFGPIKKRLFSSLDILVADVSKARWEDHLRGLLERVIRIVLPYEESYEGQLFILLQNFILENCSADWTIEQILDGHVFYDEEEDTYYFQMGHFYQFTREARLRDNSLNKVRAVLKRDHEITSRNVNRGKFNSTAVPVPAYKLRFDELHERPKFKPDAPF